MESDNALTSLLETALRNALGEQYLVSTDVSMEDGSRLRGDLVVRRRDDPTKLYIVELKMMTNGFDLPLSVANQMKRLFAEHQQLKPRLILATTSRVGNLLKQELVAQDVAIVQADQPSELSAGIAQVIRAKV